MLNPKIYDAIQWLVRIFLPATGVLYASLSDLWNLPNALEVVATIGAIGLFLGTVLGVSSVKYKRSQGDDSVSGFVWSDAADDDTGIPNIQLVITKDPSEMLNNDKVTFQVKNPN